MSVIQKGFQFIMRKKTEIPPKNFNVTVIGDLQSGKSQLITQLVTGSYSDRYPNIVKEVLKKGKHSITFLEGWVQQEKDYYQAKSNISIAHLILITVNPEDPKWHDKLLLNNPKTDTPIVWVITKSDLKEDKESSEIQARIDEINILARGSDITCIETSAKNSKNINKIMDFIVENVMKPNLNIINIGNTYKHETKHRSFHAFKATLNSMKEPSNNLEFLDKNEKATGDELKGKILNKFKESLESVLDKEQLKHVVEKIKNSAEYQIISTSQGITSRVLGLKTDSLKALERMVHQRGCDVGDDHAEERLSSPKPG